jgi:hypothetical protein
LVIARAGFTILCLKQLQRSVIRDGLRVDCVANMSSLSVHQMDNFATIQ